MLDFVWIVRSQVITPCQDISDSLNNGDRIEALIIDFESFWFSSSRSAAYENWQLGGGF
jgi:hypothetical protein